MNEKLWETPMIINCISNPNFVMRTHQDYINSNEYINSDESDNKETKLPILASIHMDTSRAYKGYEYDNSSPINHSYDLYHEIKSELSRRNLYKSYDKIYDPFSIKSKLYNLLIGFNPPVCSVCSWEELRTEKLYLEKGHWKCCRHIGEFNFENKILC